MSITLPPQIQTRIDTFRTRGSLGPGAERQGLDPFDAEAIATHLALESVVIAGADGQPGVDEDSTPGRVVFSAAQRADMAAQNPALQGLTAYTATFEGSPANPTEVRQQLEIGGFRCIKISEPDAEAGAIRRFEATLGADGFLLMATHVKVGGESFLEVLREPWKGSQ
ncbi:MAG: hypothetical protein AB1758_33550 [Candidatus Eremiobacterota bacterium]